MKHVKILQLLILGVLIVGMAACKTDEDPAPEIRVGFSFAPTSPTAGEEVTFTNASTGGDTYLWDFGDGGTSTDENPVYTYEANGTYTVTLTLDGNDDLSSSDDVTVAAPAPTVGISPDPIQIGVATTFTASVYNPSGGEVSYEWDFPDTGIISDDLDDMGVGTGESIVVTFTDPTDALNYTVTATIGSDEFAADLTATVSAQLAKTLWLAQKGGSLWSKQIFAAGEAQLVNSEIPSGAHPLTMDFSEDRLYVFDAGSGLRFAADPETTPGQIFSMDFNAENYTTHITFSNQNYDDSFFGTVDGTDLIFADRRNDITVVPTSTQNFAWGDNGPDGNPEDFPPLVTNSQLAYYSAWAGNIDGYTGPSYGFGALNGTVKKIGDVYWWAKNANHKGLYRFTAADIGVLDVIPSAGAILGEYGVRAFEVDQENAKVYFSTNSPSIGFYVSDTDGSNVVLIDDSPADAEGGAAETTYITDIEIDNESGYVYWAYRGPADADLEANPLHESGVKRYKLDGSGEVEYFVQGVEVYGLALDDAKR